MEKIIAKNTENNKNGKRRFLLISNEGLATVLAWQLKKEGNDVLLFIDGKNDKDICDGFVEKTEDWKSQVNWADVIIFGGIGYGDVAEKLRKEGRYVVGGTVYSDRLEDDREFGQTELRDVGVNTLPHWDFDEFDDAIKFITENPGRYVIKPNGKAQGEKELLFIGQEDDGKDILQVLELYKKNWAKKIKTFQIQKYASGVEVAVGAYFNGKDFIKPINVNFEHKRLFPGEIGPSTGEMGTSVFFCQPNKIFDETLEKMKEKLSKENYVGYIDINCIANSKGIYPLEFTCRFGDPLTSIHLEGVLSKWGDFMHAIANGHNFDLKTKKGFQVGVVVAVPPFPFIDPVAFRRYSEDATILFKKPNLEGVQPSEVKLVDGEWTLASYTGYALVVTGSGTTMEIARQQAYSRVRNIMIPNMFYRTDIGVRWYFDSDKLQTWGYLY